MRKRQITALQNLREIEEFAHQHGAYIRDSKEYRHRVQVPLSYTAAFETDTFTYPYEPYVRDEAYVEMHLPRDQFEKLVFTSRANEYDAYRVEHALSTLEQVRQDERVRDANPAVQQAWLKYLMLLELARK